MNAALCQHAHACHACMMGEQASNLKEIIAVVGRGRQATAKQEANNQPTLLQQLSHLLGMFLLPWLHYGLVICPNFRIATSQLLA